MNNVLCSGAHANSFVPAFEQLFKEIGVKNLYLYATGESKFRGISAYLDSLIRTEVDYHDAIFANYEDCIWFNSMMPLDKEILDKMAPYEPEALKMLERYNGNNNTSEERFMLYHKHLRYWNSFIEKADIDLLICGYTPHAGYDYIMMRLCQLKRITVITWEFYPFQTQTSRERFRLIPSHEFYDCELVERIKSLKKKYYDEDDIRLPRDLQEEYNFCSKHDNNTSIIEKNIDQGTLINNRIKQFKRFTSKNGIDYALKRAINHYRIVVKTDFIIKLYERMAKKVDYNKKYVFFALHYQPEMTTSPMGGWYVHQYLAIEMLSYYAPEGVMIYVKEHPWMLDKPQNTRDRSLYKRLAVLKNVRLVSMKEDTQKLLDNCWAVSSITGSIGYEALYKKKPYIMFGYQMMQYAPNTLLVRNNVDCMNAFELIKNRKIIYDDKDIKIFLKAIGEVTYIPVEDSKEERKKRYYEIYKKAIEDYSVC